MRALRRLWFIVTRRRQEDELAAELEFHRQMKVEQLRASGVCEAEIPALAQRALGNDLLARERSRDVWMSPWFQDVSQDVRFGLRMLVKERRFALTAIVTLGLGIAVSNTVFRFVNAAMFRDLPFVSPERLMTIRTLDRGFPAGVSYLEFREWQTHTTVFESFCADFSQSVNLSDAVNQAERLSGAYVTHPIFRMLGVAPILGRDFLGEDDREGAPPVVMLSHGLWITRYGGDAGIVGRIVRVNEQPATVIGVMPERFAYPLVADLWLPMAMAPGLRTATWTSTGFGAVGRLMPGIDRAQARSEIETIAARTAADHAEIQKDRQLSVIGVKESNLANGASALLWALLGAAVVVLVVASANVANLLLARSWHRAREIAVRLALGASRWRVVRQVLIESALIAGGGSVLGLYLSYFGFQAMSSAFNVIEFAAPDRPRKPYWFDAGIDGAGWVFLAGVFLFASLGAGLIPALHLSKTGANDVLKDGRLGQATRSSRRWAAALTVGQIAVALMLLAGGGLFARNFIALYNTDPIIDTGDLVTMRFMLPAPKYGTAGQRLLFVRRLDERIASTPAFSESTVGSDVPLQALTAAQRTLTIDGDLPDPDRSPPSVTYMTAGPRFFETLRFPVVRGRVLSPQDSRAGSEGAVVNQRLASVLFRNVDPIGKRVRLTPAGPAGDALPPWLTIVGVVPTMPDFLPNRPDDMVLFAPLLAENAPPRQLSVIVRTASKAAAAAALRAEVRSLDPDLPVYGIQTLDEAMALTRMGARMVGSWFQTLAIIAVVLACVGLYALTAHGVAQRTREIGVRMALGAQSSQVTWLFARQTLWLLAIGLTIGMAGALMSSQLLSAFLGDIDPRDPVTFTAVALLLAGVAISAGVGPARRAASVDPAIALRAD